MGSVRLEIWIQRDVRTERLLGTKVTEEEVDSAYGAWTERAQEKWQAYLDKTSGPEEALDSIRAWADHNPMTVSTTFDNEHGPDFSEIFEEAPVIEGTPQDTARLKDYAMRLRQWMTEQDTSRLFEAFRYKYAHEYIYKGVSGGVSEDSTFLRRAVVMDEPELGFGREGVRLTRWCEGRVWEVTRNGEPFFAETGGVRDVYVAEIDGELKVVR